MRSLHISCFVRPVVLPFAMGQYPLTKSFVNYIISLIGIGTLIHVARLCNLQWKTVKNPDKENLKERPKQFSFKKLEYLSIKKGHHYMTIIRGIPTGQIIYAVEGRREKKSFSWESFQKFLVKNPMPEVKIVHRLFQSSSECGIH